MSGLQRRFIDALTAPLISDIHAQLRRRGNGVDALIAYCNEEEPLRSKVLQAKKPAPPPELQHPSPQQQLGDIMSSVFVSLKGNQIRRCFLCIYKACSLGKAYDRFDELCRPFYSGQTLTRHFTSVHLDNIKDKQSSICPNYNAVLIHKNHLRLHRKNITWY